MIAGGIANNTGFSPESILAMDVSDLALWNRALAAYFEATAKKAE